MNSKESKDIEKDLGPEDIDQNMKRKKKTNLKETETRQEVEDND